jgi:predicted membrane protein
MSSRLRDVLPLTIGAYLIALGVLFSIDSFGIRSIGVGSMIEAAVGLWLVALGVLAVMAALRVRRFSRRLRRTIGHVRSSEDWRIEDGVIQTALGDILLDLREASLPLGDTELTLLCWVGTIQVQAPREVALDVTAQAVVGTVDVLGVREEGVIRDIHVRSAEFDRAERRLHLRLSTAIGELLVVQGGIRGVRV